MSWFKMHLNWAMVFGWILAIGIGIVMAILVWYCWYVAAAKGLMDHPSQDLVVTVGVVIFLIIVILLSLGVSIWACNQKGRSWGWAFLWLVPFGFIVLLVLKNNRVISNLEDPPVTIPPTVT